MKNYYSKSKLFLTLFVLFMITVTRSFAQVGSTFFPINTATPNDWKTDAFTNLNFFGAVPAMSPPPQIATTFDGLTNPAANTNDFTGLKLTFDAYISSDGAKNTDIVLGSNAVWGGEGIVIEMNKFQVQCIRNFQYSDPVNPTGSLTGDNNAGYQASIKGDQFNKFVINVTAGGVISINVNGIAFTSSYAADVTVLQASGSRFAVLTAPVSGFQFKNLTAEKGGVTKTFFTSEFATKYAATATDWTINASNQLNYTGTLPFSTPAVVETSFGGLTATASANDYTSLKLTFDAYVSSVGGNTYVVLSSNGIWGAGGKGTVIAINKNDLTANISFGSSTTLSTNAALYQAAVLPDAFNSFIIDVASDSKITITINGYVLPVVFQGSTLTASAPNPRFALFATEFSGFKLRNVVALKGGVTKSYFAPPLPVSLVSFTATKKTNGSQLNWETASEQNNSHYIVYRSTDGSNFSEIAKITGKNQAAKYQYLDASPVSGNNYYKLVQFDFDGKSEVLGVKVVNFDLTANNVVSIYPKPANRSINIALGRTFENSIAVKLLDLSGRELQKVIIPAQNETVNYVLDFNNKIISGIYIINLSSGSFNHSERIIVK